jgi:hypothetical protein
MTDETLDTLERLERTARSVPWSKSHIAELEDALRNHAREMLDEVRRLRASDAAWRDVLKDARRLMVQRRGHFCSTECLGQCEDCRTIAAVDALLARHAELMQQQKGHGNVTHP